MNKHYITVVGSSNTDLVVDCEQLPRPGETVLGGPLRQHHGGKGANQAVAAARATSGTELQVAFVGALGDDDFGRKTRTHLVQEGIDLSHFQCNPAIASGVALILVGNQDRENMIAVAKSANDALDKQSIQDAKVLFQQSQIVLAQLEIPLETVVAAAHLAAECDATFILNPAPVRALPRALYPLIDVLTPNETEALDLSGKDTVEAAARQLWDWGCAKIANTLGARGVLLCDERGLRTLPALEVQARDTVGAGDCFSGWLAAGLAENLPLDEAAQRTIRAAAIAVTRDGAQDSMPRREEVLGMGR